MPPLRESDQTGRTRAASTNLEAGLCLILVKASTSKTSTPYPTSPLEAAICLFFVKFGVATTVASEAALCLTFAKVPPAHCSIRSGGSPHSRERFPFAVCFVVALTDWIFVTSKVTDKTGHQSAQTLRHYDRPEERAAEA